MKLLCSLQILEFDVTSIEVLWSLSLTSDEHYAGNQYSKEGRKVQMGVAGPTEDKEFLGLPEYVYNLLAKLNTCIFPYTCRPIDEK